MKRFPEYLIEKASYKKLINENNKFPDLPCYIEIYAQKQPENDPKLNNFLIALDDFIGKWLYDWKKAHPND